MDRDQLLAIICPFDSLGDCNNHRCNECNQRLNKWLDEYDKKIKENTIIEYSNKIDEKLKADTNLKDTIRDIHDNVAYEMYCKGIDDMFNEINTCRTYDEYVDGMNIHRTYDEYVNVLDVLEIVKRLKAGVKNE